MRIKVSDLLEEVVETMSILEDKKAMSQLKRADDDIKAGRVRDYSEVLMELKECDEIKA